AHPGYAATNLQFAAPPLLDRLAMHITNAVLAQSAEMGALPTLYAATQPGLEGGTYVGPDGIGEFRGHPHLTTPNRSARDERAAAAGGRRAGGWRGGSPWLDRLARAGAYSAGPCPVNVITCWNVERFVQRIVNDISGSGGNSILTGAARHFLGSTTFCLAASLSAPSLTSVHSASRHATRFPLPQYGRLKGAVTGCPSSERRSFST